MENKRGNEIFLGVVGVATLLVAIIGATFAYFSASAASNNNAINIASTEVKLGYWDDTTKLSTKLIPTESEYAFLTGTYQDWIDEEEFDLGADNPYNLEANTYKGAGLCTDSKGNSICGVYDFMIGNPGNSVMEIEGMITVTTNGFQNLYFAIYDERNVQVVPATKFPTADENGTIADPVVELTQLQQELVGTTDTSNITEANELDPSAYIPNLDMSLSENAGKQNNVRKYKMVIWVKEYYESDKPADQTEADSGKMFTASVKFQTLSGAGVSGVIAAYAPEETE